jgi:hypothetical protein
MLCNTFILFFLNFPFPLYTQKSSVTLLNNSFDEVVFVVGWWFFFSFFELRQVCILIHKKIRVWEPNSQTFPHSSFSIEIRCNREWVSEWERNKNIITYGWLVQKYPCMRSNSLLSHSLFICMYVVYENFYTLLLLLLLRIFVCFLFFLHVIFLLLLSTFKEREENKM